MKAVHKTRLLKLADFLEKLPRKKFNFNAVVLGDDRPNKTLSCGSQACAIGWCPVVFPRLSEYYNGKHPAWRNRTIFVRSKKDPAIEDFEGVGQELFGLTYQESCALFDPGYGGYNARPDLGLKQTKADSTPKAVAKNIRLFVKRKEEGKI